jgi:hypothetical protein
MPLRVEQRLLRSAYNGVLQWQIPVDDIALIGEFTISAWPGAPDYCDVFVRSDGTWEEVIAGEKSSDGAFQELRRILASPLLPVLVRSTTWNSAVIWPGQFYGRSFMKLSKTATSGVTGWLQRVFRKNGKIELEEWVHDYLRVLRVK